MTTPLPEVRRTTDAIALMLQRVDDTLDQVEVGVPHWADTDTGTWHLTPDGDWTGGAWVGQLWLAHHLTGEERYLEAARRYLGVISSRATLDTAFKGFTFYYGAAAGWILSGDETARDLAIQVAASLAGQYDEWLGLIPLGSEAEEGNSVGLAESSIDSLQASPLLSWSAAESGLDRHAEVAARHTDRVLAHHVRPDASVVQSTTLDPETSEVVRSHTHKGFSETSTWGRAQAWAMLYSALGFLRHPDRADWRDEAIRVTDWWLEHVPADLVAYWDFDDTAIPDTERDTAATAIASAAMLKLADALGEDPAATRYRDAAAATVAVLARDYLTPTHEGDARPAGILTEGCFTKRPDSRPQDQATSVELVFGRYFLLESLATLDGRLEDITL